MQQAFGFERNHYDRLVHFSYGLLLSYPLREVFLRIATTRGIWGYWLPIELTLAFSGLYEIAEWLAVAVVSPQAGAAFLGNQGDIWDAQKDMTMAGIGALIAMGITMRVNWRYDRLFSEKIGRSLHQKKSEPLGEVAFAKMKKRRKK